MPALLRWNLTAFATAAVALSLLVASAIVVSAASPIFGNAQSADRVLGQASLDTGGSGNTLASMNQPSGVAYDKVNDRLWVVDSWNHRVLRFDNVSTKTNGAAADGVLGGYLSYPNGVAIDGTGHLWVADTEHHRVLRWDNAAAKPNNAAPDSVLGQPDLTRLDNNNPAADRMRRPHGLALDANGTLWVSEVGFDRVMRFDNAASKPIGGSADGVLGQLGFNGPTFSPGVGMNNPNGLTVDASGTLWVASRLDYRVTKWNNAASKPNGASPDGYLNLSGRFVSDVAMDADGRLWVATNANQVFWFNSAAAKSNGSTADGSLGLSNGDSGTSAGTFNWPMGITLDGSGNLWVADQSNSRVLHFSGIQPPSITTSAPATATEDTLYTYDANVQDAGSGVTWSLVSPTHTCSGSIDASTGVATFTPAGPTPASSCVVAIKVCYTNAPTACATQTTTVSITAVNDAPTISTTAPTTATEDTAYTYDANVTDPDGPTPTWTLVSPTHTCGGSINSSTGVVTFTPTGPVPAANCVSSIQVCDNGTPNLCSAAQTTTVTITAVNDAPTITTTAPTTATEDTLYTYDADSSDPDGPPTGATWSLVSPTHTCGGSIDSGTGVLTFTRPGPTPAANCVVAIKACDSATPSACSATQTATVTVTAVNDAPTISTTAPTSATEGTAYTYDANVTDPDGPSAVWSLVAPTHTCGGSINSSTGVVTFTPTGPVPASSCVVAIQVCDGGTPNLCSATQTATITITAVNDPPIISSTAPTTALEGVAYIYDAAVQDPDGPSATWNLVAPTHTCGGTIDSSTGVVTFTQAGPVPPSNCVVAIRVCDGAATSLCATQTAAVTITAVNSAPSITTTAPATATEDVLYTYDANAQDPDGPSLTWTLTSGAGACGGTIGSTTGLVEFTPAGPTPPSSCVLAIRVCDGGSPDQCTTQTTTISITAVNSAPTITSDAPTTATEGVAYLYDATPEDLDGPDVTWSLVAGDHTCAGMINAATGALTFTAPGPVPPANCVVAIKVCDGGTPNACATQTTTVTITPVNDPPTIPSIAPATAQEDVPYVYQAARLDVDGPGATWSLLETHTCGGAISATGLLTFTATGPTPPSNCVVAVQVCDGGSPSLCATQSTAVQIVAVNTAPSITTSAPTTATEDIAYTYDANVQDTDGPGTTWSLVTPGHTCGGTIDSSTGLATFTPTGPNPPATCVLAIRVCDGGSPDQCATQSATISITGVNDAPTISSVAPTTATEDTLYSYDADVTDADGPSAAWSLVTGTHTCGGSINAGSGLVTFTPAGPVPAASCTVAIQVCDGASPSLCATQTATVTITATNDAPSITTQAPTTATTNVAYSYSAVASDPDGPGATWSLVSGTHTCGGAISASGIVTFTPAPTSPATCVVAIRVCDGGTPELCATQSTTVTTSVTKTLTTAASPTAGGTVRGGGTYATGAVVSVTKTANAGYAFVGWSGACTGTGACSVTMTTDKSVTANFAPTPETAGDCRSNGWKNLVRNDGSTFKNQGDCVSYATTHQLLDLLGLLLRLLLS